MLTLAAEWKLALLTLANMANYWITSYTAEETQHAYCSTKQLAFLWLATVIVQECIVEILNTIMMLTLVLINITLTWLTF